MTTLQVILEYLEKNPNDGIQMKDLFPIINYLEEHNGVLFNGTGAPSDSLGDDGNYYLDTTAGDLYLKASTWGVIYTFGGGGGGAVNSVTGFNVNNADPANPVMQIVSVTVAQMQTKIAGGTVKAGERYIITNAGAATQGLTCQIIVEGYSSTKISPNGFGMFQNAVMANAMMCIMDYNISTNYITKVFEPLQKNEVSISQALAGNCIEAFLFDDVNFTDNIIIGCNLTTVLSGNIMGGNRLQYCNIDYQSHLGVAMLYHYHYGANGTLGVPDIQVTGDDAFITFNTCNYYSCLINIGANSVVSDNVLEYNAYVSLSSNATFVNNNIRGVSQAAPQIKFLGDGQAFQNNQVFSAFVNINATYAQFMDNTVLPSSQLIEVTFDISGCAIGQNCAINTLNGYLLQCEIGANKNITTIANHTEKVWIDDHSTFEATVDCATALTAGVLSIPNYCGYIYLISANANETITSFTSSPALSAGSYMRFKVPIAGTPTYIQFAEGSTIFLPTPSTGTKIYANGLDFWECEYDGTNFIENNTNQF